MGQGQGQGKGQMRGQHDKGQLREEEGRQERQDLH